MSVKFPWQTIDMKFDRCQSHFVHHCISKVLLHLSNSKGNVNSLIASIGIKITCLLLAHMENKMN